MQRRQSRLVAAVGAAERGLADAGILADQGERREAAGSHADLLRQPGERLERGVLRHAQVEADPVLQRTEVDTAHGASRTALSRAAPLRMAPLPSCLPELLARLANRSSSSKSLTVRRSLAAGDSFISNYPPLQRTGLGAECLGTVGFADTVSKREERMSSRRTGRLLAALAASAAGVAAFAVAPSALAQDKTVRAQAVALGAAHPSAAEGDGGLGRVDREGVERDHQVQDLPVAAARQGVRPLRHGARRHRRPHLRQSRLSARPLPDHRSRRAAVPGRQCQGRHPRRSTPGIANTPPPR